MKKITIFSFVFIIFFTLNAREAIACDCIIWTSDNLQELVEKQYYESEAVFSGEVVEVDKKPGYGTVKVKFKIKKSWKNISHEEVSLITGVDDSNCGYKFEVGKKYLVYTDNKKYPRYGQGETDILEASICSRTALAEANKDIAFLNKIKKTKIKSSPK